MNNLSLTLWLADIIGNLGPLLIILGTGLGLGGAFSCAAYFIESTNTYDQKKDKYVQSPDHPGLVWVFPPLFVFMLLFFTAAALLPSKQTVLLIAGSEAVEDFAATPAGTELGQTTLDLIKLLKEKITEATGDKDE